MKTKICSKCGEEKNVSEFIKERNTCKECHKKRCQEYAQKNKEKIRKRTQEYAQKNKEKRKQYNKENKEKINETRKKYLLKNAAKLKEYNKKYYKENKKHSLKNHKKWADENKEKLKKYSQKQRNELSDNYIADALRIPVKELRENPHLLKAKRNIITLTRNYRKFKQLINN